MPKLFTDIPDCCGGLIAQNAWAMSGHRQDGDEWICPECRTKWIHCCDEAEGCHWVMDGSQ